MVSYISRPICETYATLKDCVNNDSCFHNALEVTTHALNDLPSLCETVVCIREF